MQVKKAFYHTKSSHFKFFAKNKIKWHSRIILNRPFAISKLDE